LLLDTTGPALDQVASLHSILLLRDPFPVLNTADPFNFGSDPNTRVIVFLRNFQLDQGEAPSSVIVNLIDANNQNYDVPAEGVQPVPDTDFIQVVFRLPDTLAPGTCTIRIKAHAQTSNAGTLRIKS
jgi:hypothetical protein